MQKKNLNNPNKPAVKTRKVKTKLGDSVTIQTTGKHGSKKTEFNSDGKPVLDKSGNLLKGRESARYGANTGGPSERNTKNRLRKNSDTAAGVRLEKSIQAQRAKTAKKTK